MIFFTRFTLSLLFSSLLGDVYIKAMVLNQCTFIIFFTINRFTFSLLKFFAQYRRPKRLILGQNYKFGAIWEVRMVFCTPKNFLVRKNYIFYQWKKKKKFLSNLFLLQIAFCLFEANFCPNDDFLGCTKISDPQIFLVKNIYLHIVFWNFRPKSATWPLFPGNFQPEAIFSKNDLNLRGNIEDRQKFLTKKCQKFLLQINMS